MNQKTFINPIIPGFYPDPCFYSLTASRLILDLNPRSVYDAPYPMRIFLTEKPEIKLLFMPQIAPLSPSSR